MAGLSRRDRRGWALVGVIVDHRYAAQQQFRITDAQRPEDSVALIHQPEERSP